MKISISMPPTGGNSKERLDSLTVWLYALAEELNVALSNLGIENFNDETANILSKISEKEELK